MTDDGDGKRLVLLDPDGPGTDQSRLSVIVAAPTGVVHRNQDGGVACTQYTQEGYLIPLFGQGLDAEPRKIFTGRPRRPGTWQLDWTADLLDRLRAAVAEFAVHGSTHRDGLHPTPLSLDGSRLAEADEAWIPVRTPDGPGILAWENSDQGRVPRIASDLRAASTGRAGETWAPTPPART